MSTTFVSDGCTRFGHPEVTVTFVEAPLIPSGERLIINAVEGAVARGTRFSQGQTMAIGGHLLRFCDRPDGTLGVEEPVPAPKEEWVEGVDRTVRELSLQKYLCESVSAEVVFPLPKSSVTVARCADAAEAITLARIDGGNPERGFSGWSLACGLDHEHGERFLLPVLALSALKPELVPFLALPAESVVLIGPHGARVFCSGEERTPLEGSYLARWNARRVKPD